MNLVLALVVLVLSEDDLDIWIEQVVAVLLGFTSGHDSEPPY